MSTVVITIPERLAKALKGLGVDLSSYMVELLVRKLKLNPVEELELHIGLAKHFLEEGLTSSRRTLFKLVKCVKILTLHFNVSEALTKVRERSRWTATELEKAVEAISHRTGPWFEEAWDRANYLHVWGFHEARRRSR